MPPTPREKLASHFDRLRDGIESGDIEPETLEAFETYRDTIDAAKPTTTATGLDGETFACKPNTVEDYVGKLLIMAEAGVNPVTSDAADINDYMDRRHDDGDGIQANTLIKYQAAARSFYSIFPGYGVDPEDIDTYTPDSTPRHDIQDLYTEAEVFALRQACARSRDPTRNRAFLELLIFSLQRLTALLTLRVGDVDTTEGAIYLNDDYDREHGGLKNALQRGRRRPIYGARKYVRDLVRARDADEDEWLFIGDPNHPDSASGEHWSPDSAHELLHRLGEWAGVDKPMNPHNFRHYGFSVLRWDYQVDWDELNAQAGVVKGSDIGQTTYGHIDDDDLRRKIEERLGIKEPEDRNRFAPVMCPVCDEVLKSDWRKCPVCDETFAPGGDEGREELEWLETEVDMTTETFERAVGRVFDKKLEERLQDDPSL